MIELYRLLPHSSAAVFNISSRIFSIAFLHRVCVSCSGLWPVHKIIYCSDMQCVKYCRCLALNVATTFTCKSWHCLLWLHKLFYSKNKIKYCCSLHIYCIYWHAMILLYAISTEDIMHWKYTMAHFAEVCNTDKPNRWNTKQNINEWSLICLKRNL